MAQVDVSILETTRSLIDLTNHSSGNFGLGEEWSLTFLFEDIILVEYVDGVDAGSGDLINRGGIYVPTNAESKAWRKAKVILAGPAALHAKVGDIVMFPNDKGVSVANIQVEGHGLVKKGMFLNEKRLFGVCKKTQ